MKISLTQFKTFLHRDGSLSLYLSRGLNLLILCLIPAGAFLALWLWLKLLVFLVLGLLLLTPVLLTLVFGTNVTYGPVNDYKFDQTDDSFSWNGQPIAPLSSIKQVVLQRPTWNTNEVAFGLFLVFDDGTLPGDENWFALMQVETGAYRYYIERLDILFNDIDGAAKEVADYLDLVVTSSDTAPQSAPQS